VVVGAVENCEPEALSVHNSVSLEQMIAVVFEWAVEAAPEESEPVSCWWRDCTDKERVLLIQNEQAVVAGIVQQFGGKYWHEKELEDDGAQAGEKLALDPESVYPEQVLEPKKSLQRLSSPACWRPEERRAQSRSCQRHLAR
jgi:hypothetical protein